MLEEFQMAITLFFFFQLFIFLFSGLFAPVPSTYVLCKLNIIAPKPASYIPRVLLPSIRLKYSFHLLESIQKSINDIEQVFNSC